MTSMQSPRRKKRRGVSLEPGTLTIPPGLSLTPVQRQRVLDYRREQISYRMLLGWTISHIADDLGISMSLAATEAQMIQATWRFNAVEFIEKTALTDIARLDFIIAGLLPRILNGDMRDAGRAAEAVIKAIQEKGSILGYRQGVVIDVEAELRQLAIDNGYDPDEAMEVASKLRVTVRS